MNKRIVIVGGGISGLSVLHFLKKKYAGRSDIVISLQEKNDEVGGTIRSQVGDHALFETGPNGFLATQPATFELIRDLGLEDQIIQANAAAQKRFISLNGNLHALPMNPWELWNFKPMKLREKFRLFKEFFIAGRVDDAEVVAAFAKRRFGQRAAEIFFDPMVTGIFAGDAQALNLKESFPKLFESEMVHGSVIRGLLRRKKGKMSGKMKSFKKGMGEMTHALGARYRGHINSFEEVLDIRLKDNGYLVQTIKGTYPADEVYVCSPAHSASNITKNLDATLSDALAKITYAPCAVVGFIYKASSFPQLPQGFGFLVPSSEKKCVLGVLIESNVFEGRSVIGQVMLRVMLGGAHNSDVVQKSTQELVSIAKDEITNAFGATDSPLRGFISVWPKAIPQYTNDYVALKKTILERTQKLPNFHIVANFLGGISFNDCIRQAKWAVAESQSHVVNQL